MDMILKKIYQKCFDLLGNFYEAKATNKDDNLGVDPTSANSVKKKL